MVIKSATSGRNAHNRMILIGDMQYSGEKVIKILGDSEVPEGIQRIRYQEQLFLAAIAALIYLVMEWKRDFIACTGNNFILTSVRDFYKKRDCTIFTFVYTLGITTSSECLENMTICISQHVLTLMHIPRVQCTAFLVPHI